MRIFKPIQRIAFIFVTLIFWAGTVSAQSSRDGLWKAVDYNGNATFTAVITVKGGKVTDAELSTVCDPMVCNNDTWSESCEVDFFAKNKPLTNTSISCGNWRSMSGNVFGSMTTDGSDKNAGAANLKFLNASEFALFEAEAAKSDGNPTTREFASRIAEMVAKKKQQQAEQAASKKRALEEAKTKAARDRKAAANRAQQKKKLATKAPKKKTVAQKPNKPTQAPVKKAKTKTKLEPKTKPKTAAGLSIKKRAEAQQLMQDLRGFVSKNPGKIYERSI